MLRVLTDNDFNERTIEGVFRIEPTVDLIRVREVGLARTPDPLVLAWAADHGRVLLTHDVQTMVGHAYERVARGLAMPGVVAVRQLAPVGRQIDELALTIIALAPPDIDGQVLFIPM
jgi:hypothetical protein